MKTVKKKFELVLNREIHDGLGLSAESLENVMPAFKGAFQKAFLDAVQDDKILPTALKLEIVFEITGSDLHKLRA